MSSGILARRLDARPESSESTRLSAMYACAREGEGVCKVDVGKCYPGTCSASVVRCSPAESSLFQAVFCFWTAEALLPFACENKVKCKAR